jgi:hypothetical protein
LESNFKNDLTTTEYKNISDCFTDICLHYNEAITRYEAMKIDPERAVNSTSLKYTIYYLRT